MEYLKKNWLVILIGCLSAILGILTLLTVAKLKKATPVAPSVPQRKPEAVTEACTLTFKLNVSTPTPTKIISPTPEEEITPTPTGKVTPTPSEEVSTTTTLSDAPVATATSKPNEVPICTGLSANPTSGKAPLNVSFTGNAVDQDGKITAFEFTFGDGSFKTVEKDVEGSASHSLEHTYSSFGTYLASLRVKDNNDVWSDIPESCKVKIEVEGVSVGVGGLSQTSGRALQTPTASPSAKKITPGPTATSSPIPVPEVPEVGLALPTILTIISGFLLILLGAVL